MKNIKLWQILLLVSLFALGACDSDNGDDNPPTGGTGDLVINEFMASNDSHDVDGTNTKPDWIELFNPGTTDIDVGGWYMTDGISSDVADWWQIPAGGNETNVPAGGWLVLFANGSPDDGALYLDFSLKSSGETIGLADADENVVDSLIYEQQTTDLSMGLSPDGVGEMTFLVAATPGAANSASSGNLPPVIADVDLDPVSPLPNEAVTVNAEVFDDNGIFSVILYYRVAGGALVEVAMTEVNKETGDYTAEIPAQAVDTLVEYYILATDSDTETTTEPSDAPASYLSYTPLFQLDFVLFINEFMASNATTLMAPGEYENPDEAYVDWIEIYNPGETAIDIGGMYITDDLTANDEWLIPATEPDSTTIAPGEYLIVYADKKTNRGVLHVNFKLGSGGEDVGLFADDGAGHILMVDGYTYLVGTEDISEGREVDGSDDWTTFVNPTPGAANGTGK